MELVTILILLVWSIVNAWACLHLAFLSRKLDRERHDFRRWQYLVALRDRQEGKWN
jgi:hypothetical protein